MSRILDLPQMAGKPAGADFKLPGFRPLGDDIAALRPLRAILCRRDYWLLNEHRRRYEDLGGPAFVRLAQLIRAKMSDATVVSDDEPYPDIVTGTSRVFFTLDGGRLKTRLLYHHNYPEGERSRLPVGTFLGATLIGMTVGQHMPLLSEDGIEGELQVLRVQTDGIACGMSFD